jgi:pyruvate formate lyase activating enzyme
MTEPDNTPARTLLRAAEIGREAGLHYVYSGNLPGRVEEYEDTFCSHCNAKLIRRSGYVILEYHITDSGQCPNCRTRVPGLWPQDSSSARLNGVGLPIPVY